MRPEKEQELKNYIQALQIKERLLQKNPEFITIYAHHYQLNNGMIIPREQIIKGGKDGSAVIIFPVTTKNEVITVVEPRVFTKTGIGIGFPAGYIETDETPEMAAQRELEEETGYTPKQLIHLISFYQDEGCSSAFNHSFLALDCIKIQDQKLDKDECTEYLKINQEEVEELIRLGYINGANSLLTYEKVKTYQKERKIK